MRTNIYELRDSGMYNRQALEQCVKNYYDTQAELNDETYADAY